MGDWQANLADLQSIGITVTQAHRDVLARGGEVLILQGLPEAGSEFTCGCGCEHPQFDHEGTRIMVAAILDTQPLHAQALKFHRAPGIETMGQLADENYGPHWRFWPSYIGLPTKLIDQLSHWEMTDFPWVRRLWDGIPVAEIGKDVALAVVEACNARVEATAYYYIECMLAFQNEGMIYAAEDEGKEHVDEEYFQCAHALAKSGLWDMESQEWTTEASELIDFPPMEQYLSGPALQAWNTLNARSWVGATKARATIRRGEINAYQHAESEYEAWF